MTPLMRFVVACWVVCAALYVVAFARARSLPASFVRGALCVHRHEGSWRDPGGPYYGGMQMDLTFQRTYAPRLLRRLGTADHWTPHQQLVVSYRAYHSGRGWWPWPTAARTCGLL